MIYVYISVKNNRPEEILIEIKKYLQNKDLSVDKYIHDEQQNTVCWKERDLYPLLHETMEPGSVVIFYEASHLGRSTSQVLEVMETIVECGVTAHFVKYNQVFPSDDAVETEGFLELLQNVDSDFIAKRTTDNLAHSGRSAGRPKGRKNKSLKLDRHREEIERYLSLNINRASIAKLLGCHPQTLQNYIDLKQLKSAGDAKGG